MTWNNKTSDIIAINGSYTGTSLDVVYIPLAGSTTEAIDPEDVNVNFHGNSKTGRVLSINFMTDSVMGLTDFTIVLDGTLIGTKTVNINTADIIYNIKFSEGMDSGTNEFNDFVAIGVNPATAGSSQVYSVVFEMGLF